jgi:hypothetical protein
MKYQQTYIILIVYFIFLFYKKIFDYTVEYYLPTYKNLDKKSNKLQTLVKIRNFNSTVNIIFTLYIIFFLKTNIYIVILMLLSLISSIRYFFIDYRYIYYIINKTPEIEKNIDYFDRYGDKVFNYIFLAYTVYVMIKLFVL